MVNIDKTVIKEFEDKSLKEISDAPVHALQGVSENDGKLLKEAFNVKSVKDLANLKFVRWAIAISDLAAYEQA